jgi:hypothetical protein
MNIIQTKVWLFVQKEHFTDHKDLPKLEKEINAWCVDHKIENTEDTIMNWEFGDSVVLVTLVYSLKR